MKLYLTHSALVLNKSLFYCDEWPQVRGEMGCNYFITMGYIDNHFIANASPVEHKQYLQ